MNFRNGPSRRLKLLIHLTFLVIFSNLSAQSLRVTSVALKGEDVIIKYDLVDDDLEHKYALNLYSSNDNYVQPLKMIEGDIGIDQVVGGNKQIIWHARQELGEDFKGDVSLEVKGKIYIPFVTLNSFDEVSSMKRGRPYNITWAAGRGSSVLTIELLNRKEEVVHTFTNIANVGEYELEIPKDIKSGKGYRFRITDQKNKEDVVLTPAFSIDRKVPLVAKAIAAGLIGSGIFLLNNSQATESGGEEVPLLPDPVTPF